MGRWYDAAFTPSVDIISPASVRELMINRSIHVHVRIFKYQQASVMFAFEERVPHKGQVWKRKSDCSFLSDATLLPTFPRLQLPYPHRILIAEECLE